MTILNIDGYKLDHRRQYPEKTTKVYSNYTARGSRVDGQDHTVFFGLQYFLQKYMSEDFYNEFFRLNKAQAVPLYKETVDNYLGPNEVGTKHIANLHDLGYVPLEFKALKEGTKVPLRVPMVTVENTIPEFFWLVNYIETIMSCTIWLPITSATNSVRLRNLLNKYAEDTGANKDFVQWQGHDFSFRGMGGLEAAKLSGAGHLVGFTGTDTVPAIRFVKDYYQAEGLIGGSVPASEHAVMCANGKDSEKETLRRFLSLYPTGIVSVVSDTWDLWKLVTEYLVDLKSEILARNGKLVIRPDSGNPLHIICGDPSKSPNSPEGKGIVQLLWEIFGGTVNAQGFKTLNSHIGVIYGDSITYNLANEILKTLKAKGFASDNVVFGVGSYTYQYVSRDTYGQAMKATWAEVDGESRDLYKDPITDSGLKRSAKGRLAVLKDADGRLRLIEQANKQQEDMSELKTVWRNGAFTRTVTFAEIRENAFK